MSETEQTTEATAASPNDAAAPALRLAAVGDIHLYRLTAKPWKILNKRLLGLVNLWLSRRHHFRPKLLPRVMDRVREISPNLLLLSGDVTTTSLRKEFDDVAEALRHVGDDVPIVAVPGNHDRYVYGASWNRLMEKRLPGMVPEEFPHFMPLTERWHLLGLDASRPTPLTARGRVGSAQLAVAREQLETMNEGDGLVVVCHYPAWAQPEGGHGHWQHRLIDASAVRELLREGLSRVVYVHGHIHRPWRITPEMAGFEHVTDLNLGAPCLTGGDYPHGQGFWQIDLPADPANEVGFTHHVLNEDEQWEGR